MAEVAQLVEQPIRNRQVPGSSPGLGSKLFVLNSVHKCGPFRSRFDDRICAMRMKYNDLANSTMTKKSRRRASKLAKRDLVAIRRHESKKRK
jgi:hypothetical protein